MGRIRQLLKRENVPFYEEKFVYDKFVFDSAGSHVQTELERAHFADELTLLAQEWLSRTENLSARSYETI